MRMVDLIKDSIEKKNQVWRPNLDQFTKIERIGTQLKLWNAKFVKLWLNWKKFEVWNSIEDHIEKIQNQEPLWYQHIKII
jgi:hypothetical protein